MTQRQREQSYVHNLLCVEQSVITPSCQIVQNDKIASRLSFLPEEERDIQTFPELNRKSI